MKVQMKKADQITAIVLLIFSALVVEESSKMTLFVEFAPGYGFLPMVLGILMGVLSIGLFIDAYRRPASADELAPLPSLPVLINVAVILGGLGLYAFLLEIAGYIVDTLLLVVLLLGVVERERWQVTFLVAVIMTAALYLIFQVLLGVSLPKNALGF